MITFEYEALNSQGDEAKGTLQACSDANATNQKQSGGFV